jgi:hypothetical protein
MAYNHGILDYLCARFSLEPVCSNFKQARNKVFMEENKVTEKVSLKRDRDTFKAVSHTVETFFLFSLKNLNLCFKQH